MLHKTPIRPGPAGRFGEPAQQHQRQADFPSGIQTAENGQPCKVDSTHAVGESAQAMSDDERELAIKDAGAALLAAHAQREGCKRAYAASGCFGHAADLDQAIAACEEARRYMEALIRGRSPAQVRHMERMLGIA